MIQLAPQRSDARFAAEQALVNRQVPQGQFAAVEGDAIVAQAPSHPQLVEQLHQQGRTPKDLVILESGAEYPAAAVIF